VSQSVPSRQQQPEPAPGAEPEVAEADPAAEPEALNRAARRAKAKGAEPSHVGPRAGVARQAKGARSHTKRRKA
jgi:hypothetical protein